MKVEQSSENTDKQRSGQDFRETLQSTPVDPRLLLARLRMQPAPVRVAPVALAATSRLRADRATAQSLTSARAGMNAEASRLVSVRSEASTLGAQDLKSRFVERMTRELSQDPVALPPEERAKPAELQPVGASSRGNSGNEANIGQAKPAGDSQAKIAATLELVKQIEQFVRAGRPGISLSLGGGVDAQVDVERTGRNQVALQIRGRRGPPATEDLTRLRSELQARGLSLSSLQVS